MRGAHPAGCRELVRTRQSAEEQIQRGICMRCICIDVNECLRDCVDMCDHVNVCVYLYPRLWVLLIHAYL